MPPNKMGRPPSDNPKNKTLRIRVDTNTLKKLDDCSQALDTNRSEIVRKGIDMVHDSLNKK
jgi:predicted transcriptional regulator